MTDLTALRHRLRSLHTAPEDQVLEALIALRTELTGEPTRKSA